MTFLSEVRYTEAVLKRLFFLLQRDEDLKICKHEARGFFETFEIILPLRVFFKLSNQQSNVCI